MPGRHPWGDLVFGKVTLALATVVLAVASATSGSGRWVWIVGSAAFILLNTAVNAARDRSIVRRLGRDYDRVQRRAVQVVADLGQLAADRFDLWMIDLYLPRWKWSYVWRFPFLEREQELSRQLSVSLVDARPQPPSVPISSGPHGTCFQQAKPLLWFLDRVQDLSSFNASDLFDDTTNDELAKVYGALSVSPLVDQLGNNCVGVLAVHVKPERDLALKALGALQSADGRRRINNACVELNGLLTR
jgi:hypothetical protein